MRLNGEIVNLNDRVFDISVQRGFGKVIRISENYFEVKFSNTTVRYDESGSQVGKEWQTLFWTRPMIVPPVKDEQNWNVKREMVDAIIQIVRDYRDYV